MPERTAFEEAAAPNATMALQTERTASKEMTVPNATTALTPERTVSAYTLTNSCDAVNDIQLIV